MIDNKRKIIIYISIVAIIIVTIVFIFLQKSDEIKGIGENKIKEVKPTTNITSNNKIEIIDNSLCLKLLTNYTSDTLKNQFYINENMENILENYRKGIPLKEEVCLALSKQDNKDFCLLIVKKDIKGCEDHPEFGNLCVERIKLVDAFDLNNQSACNNLEKIEFKSYCNFHFKNKTCEITN